MLSSFIKIHEHFGLSACICICSQSGGSLEQKFVSDQSEQRLRHWLDCLQPSSPPLTTKLYSYSYSYLQVKQSTRNEVMILWIMLCCAGCWLSSAYDTSVRLLELSMSRLPACAYSSVCCVDRDIESILYSKMFQIENLTPLSLVTVTNHQSNKLTEVLGR